jgi:RNA polymerase sigma-70 factor (ECF subfamily)
MRAIHTDLVRRPFTSAWSAREEMTDHSRQQVEEFEALFLTNRLDILKYIIRRCADTDEAADALAETFLVAWRRIDVVPEGIEGPLWLFGVARNVLLKRHTRRQLTIAISERLKTELRSVATTSMDHRLEGAVHGALSELSKSDREIVELSAWEELTPIEIAAVLGISANAARVRLHRARQKLADIFLQSELRTRDIDLFP